MLKKVDLYQVSKTIPQQRNALEREKALGFLAKTLGLQIKIRGSHPFIHRQLTQKLVDLYSVKQYEAGQTGN
jgi:hypothetical protein